jgi:hypothetical protein
MALPTRFTAWFKFIVVTGIFPGDLKIAINAVRETFFETIFTINISESDITIDLPIYLITAACTRHHDPPEE